MLVIRRMQIAGNLAFFSDNILFLSTGASSATSESAKWKLWSKAAPQALVIDVRVM